MEGASVADGHCFRKAGNSDTTAALQMPSAESPQGKFASLCSSKLLAGNDNGDAEKEASVKPADSGGIHGILGPDSFSIRQYVLAVRAKDIGKNWPFSQRYLQICLENGKQPLLPPLEPLCSGRDVLREDLKHEARLPHGNETPSDLMIKKNTEDPKHSEDGFVKHGGEQKSKQKRHRRNKLIVLEKLTQVEFLSGKGEQCAVAEKTVNAEELAEMRGDLEQERDMLRDLQVNNATDQETDKESMISCGSRGEDFHRDADMLPCLDSCSARLDVAEPDPEPMCEKWDKQGESSEVHLGAEVGRETCEKPGNEMVSTELKSPEDNKKEQSVERSKSEGGRGEDIGNSGTLPDAVIAKVCPVCRTFSSTSNTALNAHIDHCLSVESNVKKIGAKFAKPRVKARKKRSMVDICAVAPACTIEDLDRCNNGDQWTLDANPSSLDDLNWRERKKRRQSQIHIAKGCQVQKGHADAKGKKLQILSNLKELSQPNLSKVCLQRKRKVCDDRDNESLNKKNKKVALSSSTQFSKGARQSLDAISFKNFKNKAAVTSQGKQSVNEITIKAKSQNASHKPICEERMPRSGSVGARACFHKGGPRTNKVKKKRLSLKQAGMGQPSSDQNDAVRLDVLQAIDKNQLGVEMQQSCRKSSFPQRHKARDIYMVITGKTDKTKNTMTTLEKHCSSSEENSEIYTFQRKKHFSRLSLLNKTKRKASGQSASETSQSDKAGAWAHKMENEKQQFVTYLDNIPGNVLKTQDSHKIKVSKALENVTALSMDPSMEGKEQSLKNNLLENSNISVWSVGLCKSEMNHNPEYSIGEEHRSSTSKSNIQTQKAEEVVDVIKDLKIIKDGTEFDVGKRVKTLEHNLKSPKAIYNVESTFKLADSIIQNDCTTRRVQLICGSDTSTVDKRHRSSTTLLSATKPASQCPLQPLKMSIPGNVECAGMVNRTQAQVASEVCTLCQDSQMSFVEEVGSMSRYLESNAPANDPAQVSSDGPGSLEAPSRITAYEQDVSIQGLINEGTHVLTTLQDNHMSSSILTASMNTNSNETLPKKVCPLSHSGKQAINLTDVLKGRVQSIPLQKKQTLRSRLPTQNEISCLDLMSAAAASAIFSPSNGEYSSITGNPLTTSLISLPNIRASTTNYLYSEPVVQQSRSHWGRPPVSRGTIAMNSDSIRVTPVSNTTHCSNRPQVSTLVTESAQILDSDLENQKEERPYAATQNFVNLAEAVFGHSICSPASLISLPLTSHGDLLRDRATLIKDSQFADQQRSFGKSTKLTSVAVPQVVSASVLAGDSGKVNMAEEILRGSVLTENVPNSTNFQINPSAVQQSSNSNSAWLLRKQNGLDNSLPGVINNSTDRNCGANHVLDFSPHVYAVQNDSSGLISCNPCHTNFSPGLRNTPLLYRATSRNQLYVPSTAFSTGLVTSQWQTDIPAGFPSIGNADCTGPSAVHMFGNPILRLMGKNLMVANKDSEKSRQPDTHPASREEYPNSNYLRLLGFTSEINFGLEGHSHVRRSPEASATFHQNLLHPGSRFSWSYNDYGRQPPTAAENLSELWARNSAGSPSQSSIGTGLPNVGHSTVQLNCSSSTTKNLSSHVSLALMENGILHGPAGRICQAKQQNPAAFCSQTEHEVIVIDDDAEAVSNLGVSHPTSAHGRTHQLQEEFTAPMPSKFNSKLWSGKTFLQSSSGTAKHLSSDKESTVQCGSDLLRAKELQAELRKLGINKAANSEIILQNSVPLRPLVPNHGSQKACYVQGMH